MASIIVVVIGINARIDGGANQAVVKAGKPTVYTDNAGFAIR
jgi:hypothetical protein